MRTTRRFVKRRSYFSFKGIAVSLSRAVAISPPWKTGTRQISRRGITRGVDPRSLRSEQRAAADDSAIRQAIVASDPLVTSPGSYSRPLLGSSLQRDRRKLTLCT